MARGEIFTGQVERIAAGGAGITHLSGKSVFIELTAPGDTIRFSIEKEHKTWAKGELLQILEPSPFRTTPLCPLYGRCGGCSLQHLSYEAQLEAKTAILYDAFTRIGGFNPRETPLTAIQARASAPYEYRNRVQFHSISCDTSPSRTHLGFKERKSSRLVVLDDCPVADPGIRKALKEGTIPPSGKERFTVYSRGTTFLSMGGVEQGRLSILGRELTINASVFFQSNAAMLELLITDLMTMAADRNLPLADVYCGVGTFASFLGDKAQGSGGNTDLAGNFGFPEIDLVEENDAALSLARENVRGKKVNYYALTDTAWAKTLTGNNVRGRWGLMVLDPPREGLSAPFREWLAGNGPGHVAYVSCDAATLARDSKVLVEGGYILKELTLYDFYPQTAHIESLAVFSRDVPGEK